MEEYLCLYKFARTTTTDHSITLIPNRNCIRSSSSAWYIYPIIHITNRKSQITINMASKSVALLILGARGVRVGPQIAKFVKERFEKPAADANISLPIVDLASFNLPIFNEAIIPATIPEKGSFQYEHSKAWSSEIKKHDGYVLVIPEYNYSMAGSTKNAIDYLLHEWRGKPATIFSYGLEGGKNANEQVKSALTMMGLKITETCPTLLFAGGRGPDLSAAAAEGKLGEDTRAAWEQDERIPKAFAELKHLLLQPNVDPEITSLK